MYSKKNYYSNPAINYNNNLSGNTFHWDIREMNILGVFTCFLSDLNLPTQSEIHTLYLYRTKNLWLDKSQALREGLMTVILLIGIALNLL